MTMVFLFQHSHILHLSFVITHYQLLHVQNKGKRNVGQTTTFDCNVHCRFPSSEISHFCRLFEPCIQKTQTRPSGSESKDDNCTCKHATPKITTVLKTKYPSGHESSFNGVIILPF